ncbi:hypothetical protein GCM10010277_84780 [Streptomyces longisporoflavus]|uniref:helix-turn-helix domain-containing protein n=1 Tax=Streptomyces longisporoflavus TaxID=28044 RepID=UPI00167D00A6|nr:helix-turn-helix transcriptional regulator [Streptomyces longisporoflavus]GGV72176.1 hypothetical protein GCM10010277_84780 [Streptomyces longisporoflavus]
MPSPRPAADARPFAELAGYLSSMRRAARLSQRRLAAAAAVSRGTVQRAEAGLLAPSTDVLDALVTACGGDRASQNRARTLRTRARTAQRDRLRALQAPAPDLVRTADDLGAALAAAYERAGAPSPTALTRPAAGRTAIPRTTAWRIIRRKALPASTEQLQTFLDVCRVSRRAQQHYRDAFEHILATRARRTAPPRRHPAQPSHRRPTALALGRQGTGGPYDIERMAAAAEPVIKALTAQRALYDTNRLAAAVLPALEVLASDTAVRNTPAALAEGVQVFADGLAHLFRSAGREAHRNGAAPPDLIIATNTLSHGIDFDDHDIAPTAGGRTMVFQLKTSQQHGPDRPPPAPTAAPAPQPPPPPGPGTHTTRPPHTPDSTQPSLTASHDPYEQTSHPVTAHPQAPRAQPAA